MLFFGNRDWGSNTRKVQGEPLPFNRTQESNMQNFDKILFSKPRTVVVLLLYSDNSDTAGDSHRLVHRSRGLAASSQHMERGGRCFQCNQRGHQWRECHKTQCFKCKQYGHIKDDCQGQPPPRNRQEKRRHGEKLSQNTDTVSPLPEEFNLLLFNNNRG